MAIREKLRLGDLLIRAGAITQDQLDQALAEQKRTGLQVGRCMLSMGILTEDQLMNTLSEQLEVPFVDLADVTFSHEALAKIKENVARRHKLIPVFIKDGRLNVAMANPLNLMAIDQVTIQAGMDVDILIATEDDVDLSLIHI